MRYSFLLVSLLLHGLLAGQDLSFIQANARWQVAADITDTEFISPDYIYEYTFGQDTLLNDTLYTLVWYHYFGREEGFGGLEQFPQPFQPGIPFLYGAVREDLTAKQVYLRVFDEQTNYFEPAKLLYDFKLQAGDEFTDAIVGDPVLISDVDTQFLYGAERKIWSLAGDGVQIIEGVGSTNGPFEGLITSISGSSISLNQYCQGTAMDCNVAVNGMVNNRRQWNVRQRVCTLEGECTTNTVEYRLLDTVLQNAHVYFELYQRYPTSQEEFEATGILLRQDGGKVYRIDPEWDSTETLIYDFNHPDGVPFTYNSNYYPGLTFEGGGFNYLPIFDGTERKHYFFLNPDPFPITEFIQWLEGIGDIYHPFLPEYIGHPTIDGYSYLLLCFYDDYDGAITYKNELDLDCIINTTATEEPSHDTSSVLYPNPSSGWLYLDQHIPAARLQLFNSLGQLVADLPVLNQQFNLNSLASGIYMYRLSNEKQVFLTQGQVIIK